MLNWQDSNKYLISLFKAVVAALFEAAGLRILIPQNLITAFKEGIWGVSSLSCLILI